MGWEEGEDGMGGGRAWRPVSVGEAEGYREEREVTVEEGRGDEGSGRGEVLRWKRDVIVQAISCVCVCGEGG